MEELRKEDRARGAKARKLTRLRRENRKQAWREAMEELERIRGEAISSPPGKQW